MIRVRDPNHVPPGGAFIYRREETGAEFRHHTIPHLFELARKHAEANGLEFTAKEFNENVCRNAHPGVCDEVDDHTGFPPIIERVKSVTKEVVNWGRHGFKLSGQELINHRLGICSACVYWGGETGGTYISGHCKKCGCSGVKLALPTSTCPINLW